MNSELRFLIDTGANISVLPPTTKQKCVSNSTSRKYTLYAANGSQIQTFGTKTLELNLKLRRPLKLTFIIANVTQPIIGADFLEYHNLLVDLRAKKLIDKRINILTIYYSCAKIFLARSQPRRWSTG